MKYGKIICMLMAIVFVLSVFAGCQKNDSSKNSDDKKEAEVQANTLPVATEKTADTETTTKAPVTEEVITPAPKTFVVTFDLDGGTLVSGELVQEIEEGRAAVAPVAENGNKKLSWDKDFSNITSDTVVKAIWTSDQMSSADLAEYIQQRTLTVNADNGSGSGFFIDDKGTFVTNYHVIEGAQTLSAEIMDGGSYAVKRIIDFNPVYDLAILQLDISGNDYIEICSEPVRVGEDVYAVGSALGVLTGTFTAGHVSSTSRELGSIELIQTDAAISNGNSGGPLVNVYGQVVGVNAYGAARGESLNFAIKIETLDLLAKNKNWTINEFREWYNTETARSYSPYDGEHYYYSIVNRYEVVTAARCQYSVDTEGNAVVGFSDMYRYYIYNYNVNEYDRYVAYLKSIGFVYLNDEEFGDGISYYYYNELDNIKVDLFVTSDSEELHIYVTKE